MGANATSNLIPCGCAAVTGDKGLTRPLVKIHPGRPNLRKTPKPEDLLFRLITASIRAISLAGSGLSRQDRMRECTASDGGPPFENAYSRHLDYSLNLHLRNALKAPGSPLRS